MLVVRALLAAAPGLEKFKAEKDRAAELFRPDHLSADEARAETHAPPLQCAGGRSRPPTYARRLIVGARICGAGVQPTVLAIILKSSRRDHFSA